jgi:energy-coupling factor transport system ATP-binding protein
MDVIRIQGLRFRNLRIPELTIPSGNTAIIGPNGSGKTTLLRLLAGLVQPDTGSITISERIPGGWPTGFVDEYPERNVLFPGVYDELAGPLRFRNLPCATVRETVRMAAGKSGLASLLDRSMDTLSGGEKTLVAIQSSVIIPPRILILDEFDSHMDPETLAGVEKLLAESGPEHLIRCTQNMDLASRCGTVVALFNGTVRVSGTAESVFESLSETCYYPLSWRLAR